VIKLLKTQIPITKIQGEKNEGICSYYNKINKLGTWDLGLGIWNLGLGFWNLSLGI